MGSEVCIRDSNESSRQPFKGTPREILFPAGVGRTGGRAPPPSSPLRHREDSPTGPVRTKFGLGDTPLAKILSDEGDGRRAYASPFSAAHPLHPTTGALPTNFDFDRHERAQAQRALDNVKALPVLGATLKHNTVASFVKDLAAYCEQNNIAIGPLVIVPGSGNYVAWNPNFVLPR